MNRKLGVLCAWVVLCVATACTQADTFGTGDNQFTIDFVTISGDASSANGTTISQYDSGQSGYRQFSDPGDFRIGVLEISNGQCAAFEAEMGIHFRDSYWSGNEVPVNLKKWFDAAQFVNWLNTSNGHHPAYNFEGQNFDIWDASVAAGGTNLFRHKDAHYFLPTEDEWVKAAYWNGTSLQIYASKDGLQPIANADSRYGQPNSAGPWNVGSGNEELNGTFDMMGNVWEWMESPWDSGAYTVHSNRVIRGGSFNGNDNLISLPYRNNFYPYTEFDIIGFRVASVIPEPATLLLMGLGGLALRYRKR